MARRKQGGSIYISTNPLNNVPIGIAGQGISIGRMGVRIYAGKTLQNTLQLETGETIVTEDTGQPIILETTPP